MATKESKSFYKWCHRLVGPLLLLVRPIKVIGKENMAEGSVLLCANHSAMIDPFMVALSYNAVTQVHVLGKIELFRTPAVGWFLRKLGMICVDRSKNDVASIKVSLDYLKKGEKVLIFPEGTRLSDFDATAAKSGAIKLAQHAGVPIQPIFIPRKKPVFRKTPIIFGKPYTIDNQRDKRTPEIYAKLAEELMISIQSLESEIK